MRYAKLVGNKGMMHISMQDDETLCHMKLPRDKSPENSYAFSRSFGDSHHHGATLIRSVTCKNCLTAHDANRKNYRNQYYNSWATTEAAKVLEPIPASRPLPGRSGLKGIHRVLFNARERIRRKSIEWMGRPMVTQSGNAYRGKTSVVPWEHAEHNAFMLGANYMLDEVLSGFKLREFTKWRDEAYKELAEFVHGELLDDEDIPEE